MQEYVTLLDKMAANLINYRHLYACNLTSSHTEYADFPID